MRALAARWPGVARLPHVDLGVRETPLERWRVGDVTLLVKRDDLSADPLGGNKVRALELLLGGIRSGDRVLTVGATGSTHALAVARYCARIGVEAEVVTWPQEEHAVARATAASMRDAARVTAARSLPEAYARAIARRLRGGVHWVPSGGSTPLGALGHASAAMELAAQLAARAEGEVPTIVAPLGSGGTVAGLLVGLALAGLDAPVVGVQVVPRLVASQGRVRGLARRTHALLSRLAGTTLPSPDFRRFTIDRVAYGGAYARETTEGRDAATLLRGAGGPALDATYSAKALGAALRRARSSPEASVLFWLTFDGRWMQGRPVSASHGSPRP